MRIWTHHTEVGYAVNVAIIETALRERFGVQDCSHVMTAVASVIWAELCGQGTVRKEWGTKEVNEAIRRVTARIQSIAAGIALIDGTPGG